MDELKQAGVAVLNAVSTWKGEEQKILHVLRSFEFGHTDYRYVRQAPGLPEISEMRRHLLNESAQLADLAGAIDRRFKSGACAVFVPSLGLAESDLNTRALMAYAVGVALGNPTATDKHRVIWDVKLRTKESTYRTTFSETDKEAAYHTDTQYYPTPEAKFLLYCLRAASCFGGKSSVCDARALREEIQREAPWISEVLESHLLPFLVPSAFVTVEDKTALQATLAPVFSPDHIRYRKDTLDDGLKAFPEFRTVDVIRALDAFEERLARTRFAASFFMPSDSLVAMDNHQSFHARTEFTDPERHLLRIRLQWETPPAYVHQYQLVTKREVARLVEA